MNRLKEFDELVTAKLSPLLATFGFSPMSAQRSAIGPRYFKEFRRHDMMATVSYEPNENHVEIRVRHPSDTGIGVSLGYFLMQQGRPFAKYFTGDLQSLNSWIDGFSELLRSEGANVFEGRQHP